MGSNNLSVSITADVTSLQQKFAVARAETAALGTELNKLAKESAAGTLDTAGQSQFAQIAQDYLKAKTAAAGYSAQLNESREATRSFGASVEEARGQLSGLFVATGAAAAVEAIEQISSAVVRLGDRATKMQTDADVLGVTTAQFQAMEVAAEESGVSFEVVQHAVEKLRIALDDARSGSGEAIATLHNLGITNEEITSKQFTVNELLGVLHERLNTASSAQSEMNALVKELGVRTAEAAGALKIYSGTAADVAAKDEKINALVTYQGARLKEMGTWWHEVGTEAENAASKALVAVADMLNAQGTGKRGGGFIDPAVLLQQRQAAQAAAEQMKQDQNQIAAVTVAAQRLMTTAILEGEHEAVQAAKEGSAQRVAAAREYYTDTLHFYNNDTTVSQVVAAQAELLSATRSYNAKQLSEDEELHAGELALQRQMNEMAREKIDLHKRMTEAATKDAEAQLAVTRESVLGQLALQKQLVQSTQNGSGGGNQQAAAAEIALTVQELEAWGAYYQAKAQLANGDKTLMDEIQAQRLAKEQELDGKILTLETGAAKAAGQQWMTFANTISGALDNVVRGMLTRTESLKEGMIKMSQELAQGMISNLIKVGTEQAIQAATGLTLQRSAQQQAVMMDARKAASGAYASASSIPYIGWLLGPVAAAAAFAAVEGFSAEGGFDIPAGMNPMTQLHAREMVLPAKHADVIRNMADGDGAGGGGDIHIHNHITAWDHSSVADMVRSPAFRQTMIEAAKMHFSRGGRWTIRLKIVPSG